MLVLHPDSNALGTMFGEQVMSYIDDIVSISAFRHLRQQVVTSSTDSVELLYPINVGDMICLESFVTWTHKTSMEVYVNIIGGNLKTGERGMRFFISDFCGNRRNWQISDYTSGNSRNRF